MRNWQKINTFVSCLLSATLIVTSVTPSLAQIQPQRQVRAPLSDDPSVQKSDNTLYVQNSAAMQARLDRMLLPASLNHSQAKALEEMKEWVERAKSEPEGEIPQAELQKEKGQVLSLDEFAQQYQKVNKPVLTEALNQCKTPQQREYVLQQWEKRNAPQALAALYNNVLASFDKEIAEENKKLKKHFKELCELAVTFKNPVSVYRLPQAGSDKNNPVKTFMDPVSQFLPLMTDLGSEVLTPKTREKAAGILRNRLKNSSDSCNQAEAANCAVLLRNTAALAVLGTRREDAFAIAKVLEDNYNGPMAASVILTVGPMLLAMHDVDPQYRAFYAAMHHIIHKAGRINYWDVAGSPIFIEKWVDFLHAQKGHQFAYGYENSFYKKENSKYRNLYNAWIELGSLTAREARLNPQFAASLDRLVNEQLIRYRLGKKGVEIGTNHNLFLTGLLAGGYQVNYQGTAGHTALDKDGKVIRTEDTRAAAAQLNNDLQTANLTQSEWLAYLLYNAGKPDLDPFTDCYIRNHLYAAYTRKQRPAKSMKMYKRTHPTQAELDAYANYQTNKQYAQAADIAITVVLSYMFVRDLFVIAKASMQGLMRATQLSRQAVVAGNPHNVARLARFYKYGTHSSAKAFLESARNGLGATLGYRIRVADLLPPAYKVPSSALQMPKKQPIPFELVDLGTDMNGNRVGGIAFTPQQKTDLLKLQTSRTPTFATTGAPAPHVGPVQPTMPKTQGTPAPKTPAAQVLSEPLYLAETPDLMLNPSGPQYAQAIGQQNPGRAFSWGERWRQTQISLFNWWRNMQIGWHLYKPELGQLFQFGRSRYGLATAGPGTAPLTTEIAAKDPAVVEWIRSVQNAFISAEELIETAGATTARPTRIGGSRLTPQSIKNTLELTLLSATINTLFLVSKGLGWLASLRNTNQAPIILDPQTDIAPASPWETMTLSNWYNSLGPDATKALKNQPNRLFRGITVSNLAEVVNLLVNGSQTDKVSPAFQGEIYFTMDLAEALQHTFFGKPIPVLITTTSVERNNFRHHIFTKDVPASEQTVFVYLHHNGKDGWYHVSLNAQGQIVAVPIEIYFRELDKQKAAEQKAASQAAQTQTDVQNAASSTLEDNGSFTLNPKTDTDKVTTGGEEDMSLLDWYDVPSDAVKKDLKAYFNLFRGVRLNDLTQLQNLLKKGSQVKKTEHGRIYFTTNLTEAKMYSYDNVSHIPVLITRKYMGQVTSPHTTFKQDIPANEQTVFVYLHHNGKDGWYHLSLNVQGQIVAVPIEIYFRELNKQETAAKTNAKQDGGQGGAPSGTSLLSLATLGLPLLAAGAAALFGADAGISDGSLTTTLAEILPFVALQELQNSPNALILDPKKKSKKELPHFTTSRSNIWGWPQDWNDLLYAERRKNLNTYYRLFRGMLLNDRSEIANLLINGSETDKATNGDIYFSTDLSQALSYAYRHRPDGKHIPVLIARTYKEKINNQVKIFDEDIPATHQTVFAYLSNGWCHVSLNARGQIVAVPINEYLEKLAEQKQQGLLLTHTGNEPFAIAPDTEPGDLFPNFHKYSGTPWANFTRWRDTLNARAQENLQKYVNLFRGEQLEDLQKLKHLLIHGLQVNKEAENGSARISFSQNVQEALFDILRTEGGYFPVLIATKYTGTIEDVHKHFDENIPADQLKIFVYLRHGDVQRWYHVSYDPERDEIVAVPIEIYFRESDKQKAAEQKAQAAQAQTNVQNAASSTLEDNGSFTLNPKTDTDKAIPEFALLQELSQINKYFRWMESLGETVEKILRDNFSLFRAIDLNNLEELNDLLLEGSPVDKTSYEGIYFAKDPKEALPFANTNKRQIPVIIALTSTLNATVSRGYYLFHEDIPAAHQMVFAYLHHNGEDGWYHVSLNAQGQIVAVPIEIYFRELDKQETAAKTNATQDGGQGGAFGGTSLLSLATLGLPLLAAGAAALFGADAGLSDGSLTTTLAEVAMTGAVPLVAPQQPGRNPSAFTRNPHPDALTSQVERLTTKLLEQAGEPAPLLRQQLQAFLASLRTRKLVVGDDDTVHALKHVRDFAYAHNSLPLTQRRYLRNILTTLGNYEPLLGKQEGGFFYKIGYKGSVEDGSLPRPDNFYLQVEKTGLESNSPVVAQMRGALRNSADVTPLPPPKQGEIPQQATLRKQTSGRIIFKKGVTVDTAQKDLARLASVLKRLGYTARMSLHEFSLSKNEPSTTSSDFRNGRLHIHIIREIRSQTNIPIHVNIEFWIDASSFTREKNQVPDYQIAQNYLTLFDDFLTENARKFLQNLVKQKKKRRHYRESAGQSPNPARGEKITN